MSRHVLSLALITAVAATPMASQALNIVLTNDDGLTSNVAALRTALIAAGHDVVTSIPCQNQSGKGASVSFFAPIAPLAKACIGGAATVGSPGVGAIAHLEDAYYVDGTPVMATMYGLDVIAQQRWGVEPDLVISGPNEGQNAGSIVLTSGTVSNAQFALSRGIPSIAVSADAATANNPALAAEVADLTVKLVATLEQRARHRAVLPKRTALNVNVPKFAAGTSGALSWAITKFGNFDYITPHFVTDIGATPIGVSLGLSDVHLPGVVIANHTADEATRQTDRKSEALQMLKGKITVTPMQFGYEAANDEFRRLEGELARALNK